MVCIIIVYDVYVMYTTVIINRLGLTQSYSNSIKYTIVD